MNPTDPHTIAAALMAAIALALLVWGVRTETKEIR